MSRFTLALGVALLVVEIAVAIAILSTTENSWLSSGLAATAGAAFVVSGLVALTLRPENRTGVYLAAAGYAWFLAALSASGNTWVFTVGFVFGNIVWAPFTALVLAYPTGRLETRLERAIPIATGLLLTVPALFAALLDATPAQDCPECAESAIAIADRGAAGAALEATSVVLGLGLIALVVGVLVRRWWRASPALRRLLLPVVGAGIAALLAIGLVVVAEQAVGEAADALAIVFFVAFASVPLSFLYGILQTRLARASVSELAVALDEGVPLRDALAKALADPTVEVVYWLDSRRGLGSPGWIDSDGRPTADPEPGGGRALKRVEQNGETVAALLYDSALESQPELVDAVAATARLALRSERMRAELRAEVQFMETVTNTAPSLLVNLGTDGRIRNINVAALEASGYDRQEDVRGQHFWNVFIDPAERADMVARFHALSPDFRPGEYENTFTNARGEERHVYWRSAPVTDADGRVVSIVSGGLDVTVRRRRELELQRERDATTTTLESIASIVVVLDREGRIRDRDVDNPRVGANRAFRQALGWRDDELVGLPFVDLLVADEGGEAANAIATAASGSASAEVESELRCADGSVRAFAWSAHPVADVTGRTDALVLVSGVEVTERRQRESEIVAERDFLNTIANSVPSMLTLLDDEGIVDWRGLNRAFHDTFGYEDSDAVGRSLWAVLAPPDDGGELEAALRAAIASGGVADGESRWMTRDGRIRLVEWTLVPTVNAEGSTRWLIGATDVTDRTLQEEEIRASRGRIVEAADDARRKLERNLHDGAQQRLVALSVSLRLAESKLTQDPAAAGVIVAGAREELAHALDELRELARGIHPAVLTDRGLEPALATLVSRAPVPVTVDVSAEGLPAAVQAASYYVVAEALTNIAKYADAEAASVHVVREDGRVVVEVRDDGAGGADPSRGSGLRGLSDRVAALDGILVVESPPGRGTTVRAEIPLPAGAAR